MKIIAKVKNDFSSKFSIPRQPGLAQSIESEIIFEPEYSSPEAFRGLEEYSHIWIIWEFSENADKGWSSTVRPPKLGGNKREGVFATRSPFRPNPIGLSCAELIGIYSENKRMVLKIKGADMMDGTPVYDIKPYLPYTDSHSDAKSGFAVDGSISGRLNVTFDENAAGSFPADKLKGLKEILSLDPRPGYIEDEERIYGFPFAGYEIKFKVKGKNLTVTEITENL